MTNYYGQIHWIKRFSLFCGKCHVDFAEDDQPLEFHYSRTFIRMVKQYGWKKTRELDWICPKCQKELGK